LKGSAVTSIKKKFSIEIFGYGNRVEGDILPVVKNIFENFSLNIYVSCKRKINVDGKIILLNSFEEYKNNKNEEIDKIAFVSVPVSEQELVLQSLFYNKDQYFRIFVDTPILKEYSQFGNKIDIMEDFPFSPLIKILKYYRSSFDPYLIFYKKSLYKYHGISIIKEIDKKVDLNKCLVMDLLFVKITILKGEKKHFVISPRNYDKGNISLYKAFLNKMKIDKVTIKNSNIYIKDKLIYETSQNLKFLLSDGNFHIFSIIDSIKQIGLSKLILNSILNDKIQYPAKKAFLDTRYSGLL
tara:strand:- start:194 stop:1084 length:891 start_codon:yes stop_codon:yes gene_type:complete